MKNNYKDFYSFTAILEQYPDETSWSVSFPDILGCHTQGDTFQEALKNAKEILGTILHFKELDNMEIPEATSPEQIVLDKELYEDISKKVMVQIEVHMPLYRKAINNKAIKKTLTIPQWLNEAAVQKNINFSQVLQDALREQLNIKLPYDKDYETKANNNDHKGEYAEYYRYLKDND
ncbi:pilus assembly protein HicB [Bacillus pseudomycoides]|uniref:Pilus assembly protein HicB n=1 Tax=Bacillus pseudomycoides TaxID=64104 RepID=A0AA91VAK0_9BACI|nr:MULTISPECIES: type II toxin-antitoxin system HicB family antitoxin [Bacillus]PEB56231.1 pilus assembly protein HicB [Bacillus sp. AFS098217]PED81661.1 pilus assembly protein HicB [Bacillus pseudomycoides]